MNTEDEMIAESRKWLKAIDELVAGVNTVKCPVCGLGNLILDYVEGDINEIHIYCDEDPQHENFMYKPTFRKN